MLKLIANFLKNSKTAVDKSPHPLTKLEESENKVFKALSKIVTFSKGIGVSAFYYHEITLFQSIDFRFSNALPSFMQVTRVSLEWTMLRPFIIPSMREMV